MPPPIRRRFGLLDAMILVAVAAIAIASVRRFRPSYRNSLGFLFEGRGERLADLLPVATLILWPFVLAFLLIRLRKPRPDLRRLARESGFQAGLAALIGGMMCLIDQSIYLVRRSSPDGLRLFFEVFAWGSCRHIATAIITAWTLAACLRRRRVEKSWIDRAGRFLGWCWITLWVFELAYGIWKGW